MTQSKAAAKGGLEGVSVADSAIGKIDGLKGELRYRGYLITDLAEQTDYIETTYLLLHGELPTAAQLEELRQQITSMRAVPSEILDLVAQVAPSLTPMGALRTAVSLLPMDDLEGPDTDADINLKRAVRMIARLPTLVAAYDRAREGKDPIAPRDDLSHAANFLYMLDGKVPNEDVSGMLDTCLVLHAEHGFNASTFSGRVTAATLSDIYSAVVSAVGTLKGTLHGGANTAVMRMLLDIGSVEGTEAYLDALLARGDKVMGFGHRVYKVVDPRAKILRVFSEKLADLSGERRWFEMSEKLEHLMKARKGIDMNVDFYSASTYYYMGIKPDLFTPVFAISRVAGWAAHILEQYANNRLIRPRSNWVGAEPRSFVPMDQR